MVKCFDNVIIGAGMYGLYAARKLAISGKKVALIEIEKAPFMRGSYINQARLHNGYHYPRSYATAAKSSMYFERFMKDFGDCVYTEFDQIYAIARDYSWTNSKQFEKFCFNLNLKCDKINKEKFFSPLTIEEAYLTHEYSFDAELLMRKMYEEALKADVKFYFQHYIEKADISGENYIIYLDTGIAIKTHIY